MIVTRNLSESNVLWCSFFATLIMTIIFQVIISHFDLILLDIISEPHKVRVAIASMSDSQRHVHAWMTATLDVIYPVAYGAFFIGSAYRFFPSKGFILSIPIIICMLLDLTEGVVQVSALTSRTDWLSAKAILTPVKQFLFVAGVLMMLAGWISWLIKRVRKTT